MQIWQAIVLGAVQGFAEFLPVSSSGHLLLMQRLFGITEGELFFDVMLHFGTLIPVITVFFGEIKKLFNRPYNKLTYLLLATIPAGVTGIVFGDAVDKLFYSGNNLSAVLLSVTFLLTALELFASEKVQKTTTKPLKLNKQSVAFMGVAQAVAIMPGLSRSGTVISAGCYSKLDKTENATFAFLMSIPVIMGAGLISGVKAVQSGVQVQFLPLFFGVVTSAITGYIAIKVMLKVIKKANYKYFSIYLVIMATLSIVSKIAFGI